MTKSFLNRGRPQQPPPAAVFSPCRRYRYFLSRAWCSDALFPGKIPEKTVSFILLNPSTADERKNDPTIRRCIGFAKSWGFSRLYIVNLFAFRSTNPNYMLCHESPVGPENDTWIKVAAIKAQLVVAAWGSHGAHMGRADDVAGFLRRMGVDLQCLSVTGAGQPQHPLYLKKTLLPVPFQQQATAGHE